MGNEEDPKLTYINALLLEKDQEVLKSLLLEFKDCFAWTYKEMLGLDRNVAIHKLAINPNAIPIKQAPRRIRVGLEKHIIAQTMKLIDEGFVTEEK